MAMSDDRRFLSKVSPHSNSFWTFEPFVILMKLALQVLHHIRDVRRKFRYQIQFIS